MASQIQQSSDLWDLEHYLTQRRKEIDRKYDYRYSQLTQVFGRLFRQQLTLNSGPGGNRIAHITGQYY